MSKFFSVIKALLIVSIIFSCNSKKAENLPVDATFKKTFNGIINNKYKFEMTVLKSGNSLNGRYKYSGKEKSLKISGTMDSEGNFKLEEFDDKGKITGVFNGKYFDNKADGEWSTPDGLKKMPFRMDEIIFPTSCVEKEMKNGNSEDPLFIKTCLFRKFKTISTGTPDNMGRYSWEYVLYEKKNEKYVQVKNAALFNENRQQLLSLINKKIYREYADYFADPHTKDCDPHRVIPAFEFDQLGIEFEDDKINFNTSLGLGWACLNVDGATASFKIEEIRKYLN